MKKKKLMIYLNQNLDAGIKFTEKLTNEENCYGIKASASQSMIIDVFKIKYKWCWDDSYGDSSNEIKKRGYNE